MPKSCQRRVNFSFLCANLPINVSTCQRHTKDVPKACQLLIFMCNRANKRANVPMASQRRMNFSIFFVECFVVLLFLQTQIWGKLICFVSQCQITLKRKYNTRVFIHICINIRFSWRHKSKFMLSEIISVSQSYHFPLI